MARTAEPLWDESKPSIFEHIRAHVPTDPDQPFPYEHNDLPDEPERTGKLRWAPGALDGVGTHHMAPAETSDEVDEILRLIVRHARGRKASTARHDLYAVARAGSALSLVDPLLDRMRGLGIDPASVRTTARWLLTESRHREPVKLGVALLGLGPGIDEQDRADLRVLGRHSEFTLFVSVALANTATDRDRELFTLARGVVDWGRIHLVERLQHTTDPEIREWIFRHGFRNAVMDEYLAHTAATTGDLLGRMCGEHPDDETLDAACAIVRALIAGGPARDIDDYADGPEAVLLLLGHLEQRATSLTHLLAAHDIRTFVESERDWLGRAERGWTAEVRDEARQLTSGIEADPRWAAIVGAGLDSDDRLSFHMADQAAKALGLDTFDAHLRRLARDPFGSSWHGVMEQADDVRVNTIVDLAMASLPLDDIATGPGAERGLGREWRAHGALDAILQDLGRFPGKGWPLVSTGLRSPVIRNRNMAIKALRGWPRDTWPAEAHQQLAEALTSEPDEKVRPRLQALVDDEPSPD
jgi:hypothetical protein